MSIINFPSNPSLYQTFTVGSKTWAWNGYAWDIQSSNATSILVLAQSAYNTSNTASANTIWLQGALTATNSAIVTANTQLKSYVDGTYSNATNITSGTLSSSRLPTSGATAGVYGGSTNIPVITVDTYGRITAVSNTTVSATINLTGNTGTGSITDGGTLTFTGGNPGITTSISGSTVTITNSGVTSIGVSSTNRLTTTASTGGVVLDLAAVSGLSAGTYSYPSLQVDSYGRITSISNQTAITSVAGVLGTTGGGSVSNTQIVAGVNSAGGVSASSLSGGTISSAILGNSNLYVGTTAIALNRASASQTLTGISIDGTSGADATQNTRLGIVEANTIYLFGALNATNTNYSSAITSANTQLKAYTDGAISSANTQLKSYIDGQITIVNSNITSANTQLKSYTDGQITIVNSNITSANTQLKSYTDGKFTNPSFTGSGTITGDFTIGGNVYVNGTATYINSSTITTNDSLIKLANNNIVSDSLDIGFYGVYNNSGLKYSGLIREGSAGTNAGTFYLFKDLTTEPTGNTVNYASLTKASLVADGSLITGLNASNISSGTIPSTILGNSTLYVGTTAIALNRASASQSLTGISIDGSAGSVAASALTGTTLASGVTGSSLTSVGTITSGTWSGSFGAVSGASLTSLTAGNLTGTIPSAVLGNSTHYIGTTAIALNRASGSQALTGITSIDGTATNITAYTINQNLGTANSPTFSTISLTNTNPTPATGAVPSMVTMNGGRVYTTYDLTNSYPYLYETRFVNIGGSTNVPSGMSGMGYWFGMGAGDTTPRGFSVMGTSSSGMWYKESSANTWYRIIDSGNYNSYTPTLTGTGASGSWGISVTGSAASVTNAVTFNNGGSGAASGTTYNGSSAQTVSYNTIGASPLAGSSSLTTTGTVTSGTWSGSFGAVSGANLTNLTAGNLSGTIPNGVLGNSTHYIGTTAIALNRASGSQALTGITSIDGTASNITAYTINQNVGTSNTPTFAGIITSSSLKRNAAGTGYLDGQYNTYETSATTGPIYTIGGTYYPTSSSLNTMYGVGYTYSNTATGSPGGVPAGRWGFYGASNGTARFFLDTDNGHAYFSGSSYTNGTMYDGASTGYYVKPSGTSNLYNITAYGLSIPNATGNPSFQIVTNQWAAQATSIINNWGNSSNPGVLVGTTRSDGTAFQVGASIPLTSGLPTSNGTNLLTVLGGGNVGIGTANPQTPLEVSGNSVNGVNLRVSNSTNSNQYLTLATMGSTGYSVSGWANSSVIEAVSNSATSGDRALFLSAFSGPLLFATNGRTIQARIDASGNLTISGSTYVSGTLYDNANTAYYLKPSSGSILNTLQLNTTTANTGFGIYGVGPNVTLKTSNNANYPYFDFTGSGGSINASIWGVTGSNALAFGVTSSRTQALYIDSSTNATFSGSIYGSGTYYDNANTAYYVKPSSTSVLNNLYSQTLFLRRLNTATTGISWYSTSYTAWEEYMASAGGTNQGPTGNLTAPTGTLVTGWGLRSFIENVSGYGWTWESAAQGSTTPSIVAELRSSDGSMKIAGSFYATTKSFEIDHPTKEGKKLRYGSLEGPENGVYIRGRLIDENIIELPDYWTGLVDEDSITVNLTSIGKHQNLYVKDIKDNTVIVGGSKNINCFFTVFAERKDVDKLEVEYDV